MIPILSFIGWHNSGKTTIASRVVRHLTEAGYSVGVIKSSKESGIAADQPGTDTHGYARAGAAQVMLVTPDQLLLRSPSPTQDLLQLVALHFSTMDLVLVEGFKHHPALAKIEVHRRGTDFLHLQVEQVVALVAAEAVPGLPWFSPEQSLELARYIITTFLSHPAIPEIHSRLLVNGRERELPAWAEQSILRTLHSVAGSITRDRAGAEKTLDFSLVSTLPAP
ncbi:molybdopterin-guanine dinucleotide biosynthesis protein B [Desulfogranum mediterraneum]|uniref:molybdopterin-guanine dinucleotide biosynthesis protein B n=1 Tax=Desulfogranum mediterraneum TaxID=160661 RepID=UPI00040EC198|nr:molybdopterin-guanine dinucleotide biosynthesis protein B [Desulfogranum mediterraneum]